MEEKLLTKPLHAPLSTFAMSKVFNIAPWRQASRRPRTFSFILVFCHLLLLLVVIILMTLESKQMGGYYRFAGAIGCNYFGPPSCTSDCVNILLANGGGLDFDSCYLYSTNLTVSTIQAAINSYAGINESVANFGFPAASNENNDCGDDIGYLQVRYDSKATVVKPTASKFSLIGPEINMFLSSLLVKGALSNIKSMKLVLPLVHTRSSDGLNAQYLWHYIVNYDVTGQSSVSVSQRQSIQRVCKSGNSLQSLSSVKSLQTDYLFSVLTTLRILVLVVSCVFLFFECCELRDVYHLYCYAKSMLARKKIGMTANSSIDLGDIRLQSLGSQSVRPGSEYLSHLAPIVLYGREEVLPEPMLLEEEKRVVVASAEVGRGTDTLRRRARTRSREKSSDDVDDDNENANIPASIATKNRASSIFQEHRLGHNAADEADDQDAAVWSQQREYFHESEVKDWEDMPLMVKLRLLDGWRLLTGFGCFLAGINVIISFSSDIHGNTYVEGNFILLGVSIFILFISLLGFMRYSSQFTTAALIVGGALFKVQRVLISATPVIVAFIVLGLAVFADDPSGFFINLPTTIITLFSVMNCDSVWDTLQTSAPFNTDIPGQTSYPEADVFKSLFVILFVIVFTYILLRLILAVIEGLFWYVRIYFKSRKKRNQYKRAVYERIIGKGREEATRLILKPPSEQLYVELLHIDATSQDGPDLEINSTSNPEIAERTL